MKLDILASSSSGNCALISAGDTRILVDAGIPFKWIQDGLAQLGIAVENLSGVVCSHLHSDHICGLEKLAAAVRLPVYLTTDTLTGWKYKRRPISEINLIKPQGLFKIGDIEVTTIPVRHNVTNVGFSFAHRAERITLVTDLGEISETLSEYMEAADVLMCEANHSLDVLRVGPYPDFLKQRIAHDHLSNEALCEWIGGHLTGYTRRLVLGHLSANANDRELCRLSARQALAQRGLDGMELEIA